MVTQVVVCENVLYSDRHVSKSCFEFSRTFAGVTITLWKLGKKVFYFFYKINTQKIFCVSESYGKWLLVNQHVR